MRTLMNAAGLALLLALSGCMEETERRIEFQVGGTVDLAGIVWRDADGQHQEPRAELPWVHSFTAREGHAVSVLARSGNTSARMWIRVLEDGEEVRVVPGCVCDGESVTVQTAGVVGEWGP